MASDDSENGADPNTAESDVEHTDDPWTAQSVVEGRGGYPGHAAQSESEGAGLLRIGFRDDDEEMKDISWEEFREEFEERELALVYSTDGTPIDGEKTVTLQERDDVDA
ncbi:hypothetical protein C474_15394 [Halogeometricum pallidum JCM 14848]|uniref:Uncharacterized protein n=1 Tax=Halogeometricum pallidum JCM 14848 TaxID=1227487 RepID=M0D0Y5_HALPD|nr:hypothetical protein [Halogeometricum pallidum]ELZ28503.1 hypothetical protein C474_15394 [Halogeometricum pallidum JCM 14848]